MLRENIRFRRIGRREGLPAEVLAELDETERATAHQTGLTLCLALNYGSRTEIADAESGALFADRVLEAPRSFWGWTSISGAIDHSVGMFGQAYRGRRKVIDVSGDGINNSGRPAYAARDDAVARGVAINGLVIMNDNPNPGPRGFAQPPLDEFYREQVIGGPGAFVIAIDEFESFAYAIVNKLIKEIADFAVDPSVRVAEAK